jgi:hypothetical protein
MKYTRDPTFDGDSPSDKNFGTYSFAASVFPTATVSFGRSVGGDGGGS